MTPAIVSPESPIRVKPRALNVRQRIFLDGIQIAIDALQVAYERLVDQLLIDHEPGSVDYYVSYAAATSDAWTVADSAHRLLLLVDGMPGLSNKAPALRLLHEDLDAGEGIRNALQHLPGHVQSLGADGGQAYGRLSWIDLAHVHDGAVRMGSMLPSAQVPLGEDVNWELPNPAGMVLRLPIDVVTLTVGSAALDLSRVSRGVRRFTGRLELSLHRALAEHKADLDRADAEISLRLKPTLSGAPADDARKVKLGAESYLMALHATLGRTTGAPATAPEFEWWSTDANGRTTRYPLSSPEPQAQASEHGTTGGGSDPKDAPADDPAA